MKDKKVIFMGTPLFAKNILEELIKYTNVVLVVSQPDKLVGRKQILTSSPVKEFAIKNNIKVLTPRKIKEEYNDIINTEADIIITCAYGQIIPRVILDYPKYNCINVHASLLPKLRGGAPIHHAIIDGYNKTGITIMYMDESMDSGNIIKQEAVEINNLDNQETLQNKLINVGKELLIKTLPSIFNNTNESIVQDLNQVTFANIISRNDEHINFKDSSINIYNKVRGLYPNPTGYIILNDERLKICECIIGENVTGKESTITNVYKDKIGIKSIDKEILITKVKPNGKKEMFVLDYLNGVNKENILNKEVK